MVDAKNDYDPLADEPPADWHHYSGRPVMLLGPVPLLLVVAALLGVLFLFGGSLYLIAHWLGWWR